MIFPYVCNQTSNLHAYMELLVYKASAGSGKTFTLAVEYIKASDSQSPRLPADTCRDLYQQGYGGNERAHPDASSTASGRKTPHRMPT